MPTAAKDIFEAHTRNVLEMFSNSGLGLYIPPYQRPYGWDKEKVAKLLDDTIHGYKLLLAMNDSYTFIGSVITIHDVDFKTVQPIVRPEVPLKVLTVIDGQQRLTTLLLLCIAIHNHVRVSHTKLLVQTKKTPLTLPQAWLDQQALVLTKGLDAIFHEEQPYGESRWYPKMIRSYDDQWARTAHNARYNSPIAHLITTYSPLARELSPTLFAPTAREGRIEGEQALIAAYRQISNLLRHIGNTSQWPEDFEELPALTQVSASPDTQLALVNHEFPDYVRDAILEKSLDPNAARLLQLILFGQYVLNRVALTVVTGKNEDYAFTVFESLNTSGEPLTVFETFKPRVVSAEEIAKYELSISRKNLDEVSGYLSTFKAGESNQAATRDLLIYFATAESATKLSKRLADQRRYMKEEFERHASNPTDRNAFVRHLRDVAVFVQHAWNAPQPSLYGLPVDATTDAVKLCLTFLKQLNHSVVIGHLARFYATAVSAEAIDKQQKSRDFESALKAITAFSVLWRMSRSGTKNIDQEYREILHGGPSCLTGMSPLARSVFDSTTGKSKPCAVDVKQLKAELRARLADKNRGNLADRETFVSESSAQAAYTNNRPVCRFILLAAYDDSIETTAEPGLIIRGKSSVAPCLTFNTYLDENYLSLEHIAPQQKSSDWDPRHYENSELVHRIGNLVLVQPEANSMLSSRSWKEKRILYAALGAKTIETSTQILDDADSKGIKFSKTTSEIATLSRHMPHLSALGLLDSEWDVEFVEKRSRRLLSLAWDRLSTWLEDEVDTAS